ncbi:MAG: hypothetical protein SFU27_09705 [Thermonemataceae bacterium]|nr:hypothetical protein [Thermonemataceae bacterium]
MKNIYVLFLFFFLITFQTKACDICGCGVGSYYFGVMPQYHKHFVGLRYRSMSFESHLNSRLLRTKEYFHTTELWGRFYPTKRLQVMAFVPYSFNTQVLEASSEEKKIQGLNDVMLMANYNILNLRTKQDTVMRAFQHSIWLGGGVKLPTGAYSYNEQDFADVANPNFQLGTGSVDFLLSTFYNLRYKKWGFNQDISYKINTSNSNNYRFGNKISTNTSLFYIIQKDKIGLMPHLGVYYENSAINYSKGEAIKDTGGDLLAVNIGLDIYLNKKVNLAFTYQSPVTQNLARGEIKASDRLVMQISYLF